MKYIDAEKLIAEIERRKELLTPHKGQGVGLCREVIRQFDSLLSFIDIISHPITKSGIIDEIRAEIERRFSEYNHNSNHHIQAAECASILDFIDSLQQEQQKENPKSADSIPSDCVSDAECEDRWHKVGDSLPDNGRLVLAQDNLGNRLLARYDGEGIWEVSGYDNEDYYCRNTITRWCEIPSEKQKEQKPEWSEEEDKRR